MTASSRAILAALLLSGLAAPAGGRAQTGPTGTGAIRGRVLEPTGAPIAEADVSLVQFGQDPNPTNRWTARTSGAGEFEFAGLPAGRYQLIASRVGYATRPFQSSGLFDLGRDLTLEDGQTLDGLDILLPRAGAIRGRVVDDAGRPVAGADVRPQARHDGRLVGVQRGSQTNSAGEYELAGLEPGQYYVEASARQVRTPTRDYDRTWYPGVGDAARAALVRVEASATTTGIDLTLEASVRRVLAGSVQDPDGNVPAGATLRYLQREPGGGFQRGFQLRFPDGGRFEYHTLRAAPAFLIAQAPHPAGTLVDVAAVDLTDRSLEDVRLVLRPGARVSGRLAVNGTLPPLARPIRIVCPLAGTEPAPRGEDDGGDAAPDGTFTIDGLLGERDLHVLFLPAGWGVTSIRRGTQDMTAAPLTLARGEGVDGLVVTIAPRP
jgi:hypothetical protein